MGGSGAADVRVRRALLAVLDRRLADAEDLLREVVRADSQELLVYLSLARLYRARGEVGRAIRVHQNLLLRSDLPAETRSATLRGLAEDFRAGGFLRRAIAAYEELLASLPRDVTALEALVELSREAREPERALEHSRALRRARGAGRREPAVRQREAELWVQVGRLACEREQGGDAERAARKATRVDPEVPEGWVLRGDLAAARGRTRRAVEYWTRGAKLSPRVALGLEERLQRAYADLGEPRGYASLLGELLERHPRHPALEVARARSLAAAGVREEATSALRQLVERDPDQLEAWAELGRLEDEVGRREEACAAFRALGEAARRAGWLAAREWGVE